MRPKGRSHRPSLCCFTAVWHLNQVIQVTSLVSVVSYHSPPGDKAAEGLSAPTGRGPSVNPQGQGWTKSPTTYDRQRLPGTSLFPNNTHSQHWLHTNTFGKANMGAWTRREPARAGAQQDHQHHRRSGCIYKARHFPQFQDKQHILHFASSRIIQMEHHCYNQHLPFNRHRWRSHVSMATRGLKFGRSVRALRASSQGGSERAGSGNAGWRAQKSSRSFVRRQALLTHQRTRPESGE